LPITIRFGVDRLTPLVRAIAPAMDEL